VLTGSNGSSTASKSSASASLASHRTRSATAVVPSTVTVSVLNGTDTFQLAGRVATKLVADGYRKGAVANASDSTHATSIVAYTVPADRRDALAVATSLKLPASTVQLVDSSTKSVACSASSLGCNSAVVLTVGRDLAGL
jgi:LytR cell envelope-related transcriptional attenuator